MPTLGFWGLAAVWGAWCVLHSVMISRTATVSLEHALGRGYRFYRIVFNLVSGATLVPVLAFTRGFSGPVLFGAGGPARVLQGGSLAAGLLLFLAGALRYDMLQFLGVRQVLSGRTHQALSGSGKLDRSGVLGWVRHPWYLASLLVVWANRLEAYRAANLTVIAVLSIYVVAGTFLEERKLVLELGEEYRRYQRQVPMFLPRISQRHTLSC